MGNFGKGQTGLRHNKHLKIQGEEKYIQHIEANHEGYQSSDKNTCSMFV